MLDKWIERKLPKRSAPLLTATLTRTNSTRT
ncbi:hypothetical protein E3A20_28540, partial [Planctomyces bekefii]